MDQSSVVIVSDDADFSRVLTSRWQTERSVPAFTLMGGDLCHGFDPDVFELAIVGALRRGVVPDVLQALNPGRKPVLFVSTDSQTAQLVRQAQPRAMVLQQYEGWVDAVVMIATEVLRRCNAVTLAERAEEDKTSLACQATLGRYMLEMRHAMNNALTSVLGNSELLLLEPGTLAATALSQVETIRNMALRIHEILQRFSSLEKEFSFVEKQTKKEQGARAAAAGS